MEKFGEDGFEEFEEYGEGYEEMLNEQAESLREELENLNEIIEIKYTEYEEQFGPGQIEVLDQISELYNKKFELENIEWEMVDKTKEARMIENIETKIRPKSEYWADRYKTDLEKIHEDDQKELEESRKCEQQGKEYYEPYPSASLRKQFLDTKIELTSTGFTPDELSEITGDWDGLHESGHKHFESKENLSELLDKVTFEEAEKILEDGREKEKYSDNHYWPLKARIRKHYGK
ncbi:hypothetical protein D1BOALGB6SA_6919 [Olavius sp. associated proteobacterium Delta 1]|nr:hypothetical protein D1BOALGB6SA_6919 [Olavius sp. associated proteobacterium Delta 1]